MMADNEADQIIRELRSTTKQIKLYFSPSRGRSKYETNRIRTQNKGGAVQS